MYAMEISNIDVRNAMAVPNGAKLKWRKIEPRRHYSHWKNRGKKPPFSFSNDFTLDLVHEQWTRWKSAKNNRRVFPAIETEKWEKSERWFPCRFHATNSNCTFFAERSSRRHVGRRKRPNTPLAYVRRVRCTEKENCRLKRSPFAGSLRLVRQYRRGRKYAAARSLRRRCTVSSGRVCRKWIGIHRDGQCNTWLSRRLRW